MVAFEDENTRIYSILPECVQNCDNTKSASLRYLSCSKRVVHSPTPALDLSNKLSPLLQFHAHEFHSLPQDYTFTPPLAFETRNKLCEAIKPLSDGSTPFLFGRDVIVLLFLLCKTRPFRTSPCE